MKSSNTIKTYVSFKEPLILEHTIELFIPNKDRNGNTIDNSKFIKDYSNLLAQYFGGTRRRVESSYWVDSDNNLIIEETVILRSSFSSDKLPELVALSSAFLKTLSYPLNQAEVALEIDGKLVIIDSSNDNTSSELKHVECPVNQSLNQSRIFHGSRSNTESNDLKNNNNKGEL